MNRLRNHDASACCFCARLHELTDLTSEQVREANVAHDNVLHFEAEAAKADERSKAAHGKARQAMEKVEQALGLRSTPELATIDPWER